MVREISGGLHFSYTRQNEALGLGHAVLTARELVGDEPFAVLLGDVIMDSAIPATRSLIEIYEETGSGAITVQEVEQSELQFYGVIDGQPTKHPRWGAGLLQVNNLVEKPKTGTAPSNLGVSGRYVLPPEIFDYLETTKPGAGGEIQLTDGLCALAKNGALWAHVHEGKVHDAGDKLGFLKASVEYALKNPSFGLKFRNYLKDLKL